MHTIKWKKLSWKAIGHSAEVETIETVKHECFPETREKGKIDRHITGQRSHSLDTTVDTGHYKSVQTHRV
jgi:hypothetical protein